MCLTHRDLATDNVWSPDDLYVDNPSTKIDAALAILKHHKLAPGLPPLWVKPGSDNVLEPNPKYLPGPNGEPPALSIIPQGPELGRDKTVIFSQFPHNNYVLERVGSFALTVRAHLSSLILAGIDRSRAKLADLAWHDAVASTHQGSGGLQEGS